MGAVEFKLLGRELESDDDGIAVAGRDVLERQVNADLFAVLTVILAGELGAEGEALLAQDVARAVDHGDEIDEFGALYSRLQPHRIDCDEGVDQDAALLALAFLADIEDLAGGLDAGGTGGIGGRAGDEYGDGI